MSHTPGPWIVNDRGWGTSIGVVADKPFGGRSFGRGRSARNICVVTRCADIEMAQSNARLISAAPDLLEALRLSSDRLHRIPTIERDSELCSLLGSLRAAIAKATGGAQ